MADGQVIGNIRHIYVGVRQESLVKFLVCVKQVPDSWAEKKLGADARLDRAGVDAVLNDLDEYAIEEALRSQSRSSPIFQRLQKAVKTRRHNFG